MSNTEIISQISELLKQWDNNSYTSGLVICAADYKSGTKFCQVIGNDYFCDSMITSFMQVGKEFSQFICNSADHFRIINH
jgi:hypothetical protein